MPSDSLIGLLPLVCRLCGEKRGPAPTSICSNCLGPLEVDYQSADRRPTRAAIEERPRSLWRYREFLPIVGDPVVSLDTGFTPLVESPRLATRLGVARLWIKNDAVSHPSLSFKDRVVATALNAAVALGIRTVGCASTGNLANAVASQAARAGLESWIFVPHDLELGKIVGTSVYGARLVRIQGTYDDVNRLCVQLADEYNWGLVNVNLRSYYGEGSKTMAYEIVEQLNWRLPTAVVVPMAGGSLITKLNKGFHDVLRAELVEGEAPRLYGAQAQGCSPIVDLVERGEDQIRPVIPKTIARSIAIGNPADGLFAAAAIRESHGWAVGVTDPELVAGIKLLAQTTGIFTETAGGATLAAALSLAQSGRFKPDDEVVLCITGNGLKTVEALDGALSTSPVIPARLREVAPLVTSAQPSSAVLAQ